jgi:uncharacterized membrane protein YbhN (UPF0104 family)
MTSTPGRKSGMFSLWDLLKIVLALGLVIYVLSKSELSSLASTLQNASLFWFLISGALYILLTLLKALQYFVLLRGSLTYSQVLNVTISQNAVSNFFLAGAGIAAYITMTRLEHEVKVSRSVTVFILTKVGDLIAVWVALLIASNLVWRDIGLLRTPIIVLLLGIGSIILLFFFTILFRQRFVSTLNGILDWLRISGIEFIKNGMSYLQSLASMEQSRVLSTFGLLILYSFLYLAVTVACSYTNLATFHLQPDISAVLFVSVLIQLVSYFPVSVFGGLGITETSALYFWSFFGFPEPVMAPVLIGIRTMFYLLNLIPLIYLPAYSGWIKPKEQAQHGQ